jgi:hypothetical protein
MTEKEPPAGAKDAETLGADDPYAEGIGLRDRCLVVLGIETARQPREAVSMPARPRDNRKPACLAWCLAVCLARLRAVPVT